MILIYTSNYKPISLKIVILLSNKHHHRPRRGHQPPPLTMQRKPETYYCLTTLIWSQGYRRSNSF